MQEAQARPLIQEDPKAEKQLRLCTTPTEPVLEPGARRLRPRAAVMKPTGPRDRACAPLREAKRWEPVPNKSPGSPHRGKALAATKNPHSQKVINKIIKNSNNRKHALQHAEPKPENPPPRCAQHTWSQNLTQHIHHFLSAGVTLTPPPAHLLPTSLSRLQWSVSHIPLMPGGVTHIHTRWYLNKVLDIKSSFLNLKSK